MLAIRSSIGVVWGLGVPFSLVGFGHDESRVRSSLRFSSDGHG